MLSLLLSPTSSQSQSINLTWTSEQDLLHSEDCRLPCTLWKNTAPSFKKLFHIFFVCTNPLPLIILTLRKYWMTEATSPYTLSDWRPSLSLGCRPGDPAVRDSTNPQPEVSLNSSKRWDFKSIRPYCRVATTCQTNPPNLVDNQFRLPEKVFFRETVCFCNNLNNQCWRKWLTLITSKQDLEDVVPPDCFLCRPWSHSCLQGLLRKVVPPLFRFIGHEDWDKNSHLFMLCRSVTVR